jgi:recombination protein RecA
VKVVKNKMAPPFKEVEFDILYGQGVSREGDLVDLASEANIIDKSGAWFSFGGERIGQGRENAKQFLIDHPETYTQIEAKVLAHHNVRRVGIDAAPAAIEVSAAPEAPASDKSDKTDRSGKATAVGSGPVKHPAPAPAPTNGKRPNA